MQRRLENERETAAVAQALALRARPGDCFALSGELGAGKTCFARAFIRALAGDETEVPSPTFMLLQSYDGTLADGAPVAIAHWDLYRIASASALGELGLEEGLASNITLVEWPQVASSLLPEDRLNLHFRMGNGSERTLSCEGSAEWRKRLKGAL
ncbi:MAG: tRNA (adenosine(37)-N6)-threonylcarbamoyltransferase complex ATPase subunit type 1 TsaE [Alphaproteobacteria bacterium]|nr:tRNA (adenosine(37)-N6)-threonylcarbamoyltransferase complex ATPase subunit type 1 TsaE [Alphaproteobacteria bacterium]